MIPPSPSTLATGELIGGRYRVERMLGEDALGRTFLVTDTTVKAGTGTRPGGPPLALRLLSVGMSALPPSIPGDEDPLVSWRAVAARAPGLSHPGVAAATELRVGDENGRCYLVREAVEVIGQPLSAVLAARGGALSENEAVYLCAQLGEALEVAHQHGLLHLHLSPSRVFLVPDEASVAGIPGSARGEAPGPASTRVRIADLGLVPPAVAARFGEAGYLAPELLDGQLVDRRTDQFAAAVILYELLAGHPAFVATHDEPRHTIVGRVRNEDPLPLALPRHIEQALARALSRSRAVRFPSMRDFVAALGGDVSRWPAPMFVASGAYPGASSSVPTLSSSGHLSPVGGISLFNSSAGGVAAPSTSSSPSAQSPRAGALPPESSLRHIALPALLGGAVALLGLVGYRTLTRKTLPTAPLSFPQPPRTPPRVLPDLLSPPEDVADLASPPLDGPVEAAAEPDGGPETPAVTPEARVHNTDAIPPLRLGGPDDTPGIPASSLPRRPVATQNPTTSPPSVRPPQPPQLPAAPVGEWTVTLTPVGGELLPEQQAQLRRCVNVVTPRAPFRAVLQNLEGVLYVSPQSPANPVSLSDDFRNCVKERVKGNIEAKVVSIQGHLVSKGKGAP